MTDKKTILSGSTVTGNLTLGNYIGAINNWTKLQEQYNCFYMVADLHALTVAQDPKELRARSLSFYAQYLALGLDPEKNVIFMQSHVSEHSELAWILNCFTPMGHLNRMTQFKDKSSNTKNINAGLYSYPVLMAADILLYKADVVPVGEDQKQHLELCRDIVDMFHHRYGETFVVPEPHIGSVGARVMALQDPTKKMSKSDDNPKNYVSIIDVISYDEKKPGIANLMTIYSVLSGMSYEQIEKEFEGKMYGHLKVGLADLVCDTLKPVHEKYADLMKNEDYLNDLLKKGALAAKTRAGATLKEVYDKIGLVPRGF
jgi:tryptophanyl-tRNA synthetase